MKKNLRKSFKSGFTLIELLVVVAIIGILASVVLASLNTARAKGADAAVKSNLDSARAQAALFYDSNGSSYMGTANSATDVCNTAGLAGGVTGIYPMVLAAASAGGSIVGTELTTASSATLTICNPSANAFAAEAPLKSVAGTNWCIDSTGNSKQVTGLLTAGATVCPTS